MVGLPEGLLDAALWYATELGWPVFPLLPGRKGPPSKDELYVVVDGNPRGGFYVASIDPAQIREWWARWPRVNIGCSTGAAGLVVVDVDVKENRPGLESWHDLRTELRLNDTTPTVETPTRGLHVYYRAGAFTIKSSEGSLAPALDVKAQGGYVVLPPSVTPQGAYGWAMGYAPNECPTLEIPERLAMRMGAPSRGITISKQTTAEPIGDKIPHGTQHRTLVSLAGSMRRRGMNAGEIEAALQVVNETRCEVPGPRENIRKIAQSVVSLYEPAASADAPDSSEPEWMPDAPWPDDVTTPSSAISPTPATGEPRWTKHGNLAQVGERLGPIVWECPDWLARGFATLFASASGVGKSSTALRVAGCYLEGWPWLDGTPFTGERGRVLWCEAEGAQSLNVARCAAWGLNASELVTPLDPLEEVNLMDNEHRRAITHAARLDDVRLIVVDSLSGATAGHRDENSTEMLQVVKWLAALARDTGKPLIVTHHLRKKGLADGEGVITLDRLRGSSAIAQAARLVWALDTPDPATPERLRLSVIKSNLGRFPAPIGLEIRKDGITLRGTPRAPKVLTQEDHAKALLREMLASGPMPAVDVQQAAAGRGISSSTLERAKSALYVTSRKVDSAWNWEPPAWMLKNTPSASDNLENVGALEDVGALENVLKGIKDSKNHPPSTMRDVGDLLAAMTLSGGRKPGEPF